MRKQEEGESLKIPCVYRDVVFDVTNHFIHTLIENESLVRQMTWEGFLLLGHSDLPPFPGKRRCLNLGVMSPYCVDRILALLQDTLPEEWLQDVIEIHIFRILPSAFIKAISVLRSDVMKHVA